MRTFDTGRMVRVRGPQAIACGGMISVTIDLDPADQFGVSIADDFLVIHDRCVADVSAAERAKLRVAAVSAAHECLANCDSSLAPLRLHLVRHFYSPVDSYPCINFLGCTASLPSCNETTRRVGGHKLLHARRKTPRGSSAALCRF